jgi:hypothetical protein
MSAIKEFNLRCVCRKGADMGIANVSNGHGLFKSLLLAWLATSLAVGMACNRTANTYKQNVKNALEQADLRDVTVTEDTEKDTITLGGSVHSDDA